jgi:anti-sigma-K factor RskA
MEDAEAMAPWNSSPDRLAQESRKRHEIELLLPWYATGTLSQHDAQRVEQALAEDGVLARRYELLLEERAAAVNLNETLGSPSDRAMEKLFAAIDAEEAHLPRSRRQSFSETAATASGSQ